MKKTVKLIGIMILFMCMLIGCGNKLSNEENKIFDAMSENFFTGFKDPSSVRIVKVDKYYENGKYVVLTVKGANSYGGTVNSTYILFLEDMIFTEEFCEENCEAYIKSSLDIYAALGINFYDHNFSKGYYCEIDDIPSSISKCTTMEARIKALLTCNVNEDISIDVGKLNEAIVEYIEDMGW